MSETPKHPFTNKTREELESSVVKAHQELEGLKKKLNRYGLTWNKDLDQKEVFDFFAQNFPVLKENSSKRIGRGQNVLIEGDNLPALIYLSVFKPKEFDLSSFDPPYNTGNTFTYIDNFEVKSFNDEDPDFSSKWLNMISQRMILLQQCLKDDGVCFINIDEYERANLEILGRMIFPQFVSDLIWKKNAPKNNSKTISTNHEYILTFANHELKNLNHVEKPNYKIIKDKLNYYIDLKDKKMIPPEVLEALKEAFPEVKTKDLPTRFADRIVEMNEERISISFKKWLEKQNFPSGDSNFDLIDFEKRDLFRGADLTAPKNSNLFDIIHPITKKPCKMPSQGRGWAYTEDNIKKMIESGDVMFGDDESTQPKKKLYSSSVTTAPLDSVINEAGTGKSDLAKLDMNNVFDYAKPVTLIKILLKLKNKDAKCIDIFAGSGTLGQAVVELNQEDGGSRSFVLVTNNENQICEKITYERLYRVMNGVKFKNKGKDVEFKAIPDQGLSYFKVEFIGRHKNDEQFKFDLSSHILDILKFQELVFESHDIEDNIVLKTQDKVVIYQQNLDVSLIKDLVDVNKDKEITLYLTDMDTSDLDKETLNKVFKIESDLFSKAISFDILSLKI